MPPLQLPPPLAPWAPFLELLPVESALALGPLLRRLEAFVGPLHSAQQRGIVEPDGFDGLARRGSIERLLLSEWLLIDEAPLEFLRRFSQGESAYFQLARRDPHTARASLALLDCGPHVLGGPRLVEFAALLVLARRAQSAGATFRWGVWQKPGEWRETVNRESVEWWLSLRSEGEPKAHERAAWEEIWQSENADFSRDELWMIGSSHLKLLVPSRARFLEVADELDPFAPNRAAIARLDGRTLRLELPEDALGARLLRDPFALAAPKSNEKNTFDIVAIDKGLTWAQSGWKLFARTRDGELLVFSVPNSPSATVGPPKQMMSSQNGSLVAVGRIGRATVAASLFDPRRGDGQAALYFQSWGRNSAQWNDVEMSFSAEVSAKAKDAMMSAPLGSISGSGDGHVLALWLEGRRLQIAVHGQNELRDESVGVRGVAMEGANVQCVRSSETQVEILKLSSQHPHHFVAAAWRSSLPAPPLFGVRSGWSGQTNSPLWALDIGSHCWQLRTSAQQNEVRAEPGRDVLGCLFDGKEFGLLLHAPGERELWFRAASGERKLFRFSSPIRSVAVCPFAPLVAVQGEDEIGVWSLPHGAWLLRARSE